MRADPEHDPSFVEESTAVMYIDLPDATTGACPVGDIPVYRVWDNRVDTNHRYTTDRTMRSQMVAQGWVAEGYGPDQVIMCAPPTPPPAAVPPPCKGNNPRVAVPGAPHGMYVWGPNHRSAVYQNALANDVIGKDPTLCGASLVINWSDVEPPRASLTGPYVTAAAKPYTDAGLTVNLLFAAATEGPVNTVTPAWVSNPVSQGGAGVPTVSCAGQPTMPVYFNAAFEAAWKAFIAAAMHQFSFANSPLAAGVGYMRFATAGGAEALPPPGYNDGGACQALWTAAGYTYDGWNTHEAHIINAMGSQSTDKQIMVSLPNVSGGPNVYAVSNLGAAVAAAQGIGFSLKTWVPATSPARRQRPARAIRTAQIINLHWCQAYTTYAGQVPLAQQPITATTNTSVATMDIAKLLQYAIANRIQIFELYPEEWLQANSPTSPGFVPANQASIQGRAGGGGADSGGDERALTARSFTLFSRSRYEHPSRSGARPGHDARRFPRQRAGDALPAGALLRTDVHREQLRSTTSTARGSTTAPRRSSSIAASGRCARTRTSAAIASSCGRGSIRRSAQWASTTASRRCGGFPDRTTRTRRRGPRRRAYPYYPSHGERLYQANVVAVRAVTGPPEQRCWMEPQQVTTQASQPNIPGAIIGGVLGGVLGHQIGSGRGNDVATAVGAVGGAAVGANVNRGSRTYTQNVQKCAAVPGSGQVAVLGRDLHVPRPDAPRRRRRSRRARRSRSTAGESLRV